MLIFARFQLYSPAEIAASTFLLPKPLIAPSLSLTHSSAFTFIHSIFLILSLVSKVWETHHLTSWWWWCYYCSSRLQPNLYTYIYTQTTLLLFFLMLCHPFGRSSNNNNTTVYYYVCIVCLRKKKYLHRPLAI